ncbi:putative NADH-ubiquinone oxidoreductase 18 kDa subunit [Xylariaceae sp. FL0594]|nr:putative NADH-ubiquinone oxidoreductase 18 kDa subunit [Xylariaceae sp. FL0594]
MASLRPQTAARLLRASAPVASRPALAVTQRRMKSDDSSTALSQTKHAPPEVRPTNAPDYSVHHIDKATSTFSPVPKRVIDGSEETDIIPAAVISGAPVELQARAVRIYQPSKPATQSGTWGSKKWRMDWDVLAKGHRWENPLMGWQASSDFMQGTKLEFQTKEDAIRFAEKQGYEYFVQEPNERAFAPKAYANNFLYTPKKLKHVRTK